MRSASLRRLFRASRRRTRYHVEPLENRVLLANFVVVNTNDSGGGSLRAALGAANASAGLDFIDFNIPGGGVHTIRPTSFLPEVVDPVFIDGTTHPGYEPCHPQIELDGSVAGGADGLRLRVGGNTVMGLCINSFDWNGISVADDLKPLKVGNNVIEQNLIGTDPTGTMDKGNGHDGIGVFLSSHNTIRGNLISGNESSGIFIADGLATDNHIEGNRIGTDASGLHPLGNRLNGVCLAAGDVPFLRQDHDPVDGYASGNFIGGPDPERGNLIAGNGNAGVFIFRGTGNRVQGNYIGVGIDGLTAIPNGTQTGSFGEDGVWIEEAQDNEVGGLEEGAGNLISGNEGAGVRVTAVGRSAESNRIQGNKIGTDKDGNFHEGLGNRQGGVQLRNESPDDAEDVAVDFNIIGSFDAEDGDEDGTVRGRNIISGNLSHGVNIVGHRTRDNRIQGNYIGTDETGLAPAGNEGDGVHVSTFVGQVPGTSTALIGGEDPGATNIISGNTGNGVFIGFGGRAAVVANAIGTNKNGDAPIPNGENGVLILNSSGNFVGAKVELEPGLDVAFGNVIAANGNDGIQISGDSHDNHVIANVIGAGPTTTASLGNGRHGIAIFDAHDNHVGDGTERGRNVIVNNEAFGVVAAGPGAIHNTVQGNYIGVTADGTTRAGNLLGGVSIHDAPANIIGGTILLPSGPADAGNVISGNQGVGVRVEGLAATGNLVLRNLIGTNATVDEAVSNQGGMSVTGGASHTRIELNIIAGNAVAGVSIREAGATTLLNNEIGGELPNDGAGIEVVNTPGTVIGGDSFDDGGNLISGNAAAGILLTGSLTTGTRITGNLIGTDVDAASPVGNAEGVVIVGDQALGAPSGTIVLANIIAGNVGDGVRISAGASDNLIENNLIGTNSIADDLRNGGNGVLIEDAPDNVIGGTEEEADNLILWNTMAGVRVQGLLSARNTILGNGIGRSTRMGIEILNGASVTRVDGNILTLNGLSGVYVGDSSGTIVTNNLIGTTREGLEARPNGGAGVYVVNSPDTVIGGDDFINGGNLISGNSLAGVILSGFRTTRARVSGNYIGTDIDAANPLGNEQGVVIGGGPDVGGGASANVVENNVISGNRQDGVSISFGATANRVENNFIGTNKFAAEGLGNGGNGVVIDNAPANVVGGAAAGSDNLITRNRLSGVRVQGAGSAANWILGNGIGRSPVAGIEVRDGASATVIDRNLITRNEQAGVFLDSAGAANRLTNNKIGTSREGDVAQPNGAFGVWIKNTPGTVIGGASFEQGGNLISGNELMGIVMTGSRTTDTLITGNYIGTDITGNRPLGNDEGIALGGSSELGAASKTVIRGNVIAFNRKEGVLITLGAFDNTVGGNTPDLANRIMNNGRAGVAVTSDASTGNAILVNRISSNAGLGIDLGADGVSYNDHLKDNDTGPNNLQNFPELTFATVGASRRMVGVLKAAPGTVHVIRFFAVAEVDSSGFGEGERYLASTAVTTNSSGVAFFDVFLPEGEAAGAHLTATATDARGNTSEFSKPTRVETDTDGDGISDRLENNGPNGGDRNQDGVPDSQQGSVVSFPNASNEGYVTLEIGSRFGGIPAPAGAFFASVRPVPDPSPDDAPPGLYFGQGLFDFTVAGLAPGAGVVVEVLLPRNSVPLSYYRYGPTPGLPAAHWYDWTFDGSTGAIVNFDRIQLHLRDGFRGDDDLVANGMVVDPGGPAFAAPIVVTTTVDSGPGSLRQAILDANSRPGLDFINFAIGTGVRTIRPASNLPTVTDPVFIDGTTQPGFVGSPVIELDGQLVPFGTGLTISAPDTTVRGLVINRFAGRGIDVAGLFSFQSGVAIQGNYIGTDVTGMFARPNGEGIVLGSGTDHRVGGRLAGQGNLISGNLLNGLIASAGGLVEGNRIGVAADGVSALGNGENGARIDETFLLTIGGLADGAGNLIAFSQKDGIQNLGASANRRIGILSNSIHSNGLLGISRNLEHEVTLNDSGTLDGLLTNVQNFPVLWAAQTANGQITISGYLDSRPNSTFLIQFFSNSAVESSGFGEGQMSIGTATVVTDASGHGDYTATYPVAVQNGRLITATATEYNFGLVTNNTSEFSRRLAVGEVLTGVITVNAADDVDDGVADAVHTSLREAIHAANNHPGPDLIRFAVGSGITVIAALTPLPAITDAGTTIDGTTQGGFAGSPLISLSAGYTFTTTAGLRIAASDTTVRGLMISGFLGAGIDVFETIATPNFGGVVVEGNVVRSNGRGLVIRGGANHRVGGTTPAQRNVVSGNTGNGIELLAGRDMRVEGNLIGVASDGVSPLGNVGSGVILPLPSGSDRVRGSVIGGLAPGAGNVIAFNGENGIQDRQADGGNAILSNSIHSNRLLGISYNLQNWVVLNERGGNVDQSGTPTPYPVLWSALSTGGQTTISGYFDGRPNATYLLQFFSSTAVDVSGFGEGETFLGSTSVITDSTGHVDFTVVLSVAVADRRLITATATDANNNTSQFSRRLAVGDVLGSVYTVNTTDDVDDGVADAVHTSLREAIHVANNHPGPDLIRFAVGTGTRTISPLTPLPALTDDGTTIDGATQPGVSGSPIIELSGALMDREQFGRPSATEFYLTALALWADNCTVRGLVINRFFELLLSNSGAVIRIGGHPLTILGDDNVIEGNYIGTNVAGTAALPNVFGIQVSSGSGNRIGGTTAQRRNVISGNRDSGIYLFVTSGTLIQGNYIGTNATGAAAIPNGIGTFSDTYGIRVSGGSGTVIGGTAPGAGNVVSGNNGHGIHVSLGSGTVVRGNLIGTNAAGTGRLGNSGDGVFIDNAGGVVIGGALAGERNVISSNRSGIVIAFGSGVVVQGNYVGTNAAGTADLGNFVDGIAVRGEGHLIGGTAPEAGNLVSGNDRFGILVAAGTTTTGVRIEGNRIGTQANGTSALGNSSDGVAFAGDLNGSTNGTGPTDSVVGGLDAGAGNTIAFNGRHGVNVLAGQRVAILSNSIHTNGQLGIDLNGNGVTPNDAGDADGGENDLQNYPVLTAAVTDGVRTSITGTFNSTPNSGFVLQFFSNAAAEPTGFGEGRTLLGTRTVFTDAAGNASFTVILPVAVAVGQLLSATATDPSNNTSEFGRSVQLPAGDVGPNRPPSASAGGPYVIGEGGALPLSAVLSFDADGDPLSYSWDVNGDGTFGDATGVTPILAWAQLEALGITDGPSSFTVRVVVDDGQGHATTSSPVALTVLNVAPVVDLGPNRLVIEGDHVSLTGAFSDPGPLDTHTLSWSVVAENGQEVAGGSGPTLEFDTVDNGNYAVTFTVTDSDGGVGAQTVNILSVSAPPMGPVAGLPERGVVGAPIHLSVSPTDPSPADTDAGFTYEWSVYLNDEPVAEGSGREFSFTPEAVGTYTIDLRMSDKDFASSFSTTEVVVDANGPVPVAPIVTLAPAASVDESDAYVAAGSFADPDFNDTWTATVDYGDDTGVQPLELRPDKSFALAHTYDDNGVYDVVVRVTDNAGLAGTATARVTVRNVAPSVALGAPGPVAVGAAFTLTGSFADPGADTWSAIVNYGDGTGDLPLPLGAGGTFTLGHTYDTAGEFAITVTVIDDDSGTGVATRTAVVEKRGTTLAAASAAGTYGGTTTLSATLTAGGTALAGRVINFALGGVAVGSAVTDSTGSAELTNVSLAGLDAGTAAVSATFSGDASHNIADAAANLTIARARLVVAVDSKSRVYGQDNPTLTGTVSGVTNGDAIAATFSTDAGSNSTVGDYAITVALADPDGRLVNYDVTVDSGTLTVLATTLAAAGRELTGAPGSLMSAVVASFATDNPTALASHFTVSINWGDGHMSPGEVRPAVGGGFEVLGEHTYAADGTYAMTVVIRDNAGLGSATASGRAVVSTVGAGHITGGGWFDSPAGSSSNPAYFGRASLAFTAISHGGADTPKGQLQFRVGRMNFHSTSFEQLVVTGAKAELRGTGTINGRGSFAFLLTIIDGRRAGGADMVRIAVWNPDTGAVLYDSGGRGSGNDDDDNLTPLGGGDVTIHD